MRKSLTTLMLTLLLATAVGCGVMLPAQSLYAADPLPPLPPLQIGPVDGSVTTGISDPPTGMPTLIWEAIDDADRFHVQISNAAGFANLLFDQFTYATSFTPSTSLPDGIYYWRVRASIDNIWGEFSPTWSFTKNWSNNGALVPRLLTPDVGAQRTGFRSEDFTWSLVPGAATYRLELATDISFNQIVYSAETLKPHHTPKTRLSNNLYYWRVIPLDNQGNRGEPSAVRTFNFSWNVAPQLLTPANNTDLAFLPRFSWTAIEAAEFYQIEISTQKDFGVGTVSSYITPNTDFTLEKPLSNDQDYYWRVKAIDERGNSSPPSDSFLFRARWHFIPQLLSPADNSIHLSYPFFAWTPIPGVERYQIEIDESEGFATPIGRVYTYNATSFAFADWGVDVYIDQFYFWRVRGVDTEGNTTPWSSVRSFQVSFETSPNLIYPLPYYEPDAENFTVYADRTVSAPLFIWDTAHIFSPTISGFVTYPPDFYQLTVSANPSFSNPEWQITTRGLAAAPTVDNPFHFVDGQRYYWQVRAFRNFPGGGQPEQVGSAITWQTRFDSKLPAAQTTAMSLLYPQPEFEAVDVPPALGWEQVAGASSYQVEVSRNSAFDPAIGPYFESAQAQYTNYVPGQSHPEKLPFGTYWWRVRALNGANAPITDWSTPRYFHISQDLVVGNPSDLVLPKTLFLSNATYDPMVSLVATDTVALNSQYNLGNLHVALDRLYNGSLNWVIAFSGDTITDTVRYGILIDSDHVPGSGATVDPFGNTFSVDSVNLPEYYITFQNSGAGVSASQVHYYAWQGSNWSPLRTLAEMGGQIDAQLGLNQMQLLLPYTSLGAGAANFGGSIALLVFSTPIGQPTLLQDTIPGQDVTQPLRDFGYVTDLVMPLYPFDTPLSNPYVFYDPPSLRWRMPFHKSVDGYQVQLARDSAFTQIVETWEAFESQKSPYYALIPATAQSESALADNESYYWRVRVRHEKYNDKSAYDYGPWSTPMRFKLDSRQAVNPYLSMGGHVSEDSVVESTPSFNWERVEGAAGYQIQVDNDANFSSPILSKLPNGTSYIPTVVLQDGTYYWRVALRRSSKVVGRWSPTMIFTKTSSFPVPVSPIGDIVIHEQPTFQWAAVLTPTVEPFLAAPRYRVQLDSDPNFSNPRSFTTDTNIYTVVKGESIADGTWYWRVAIIDADGKSGTYSPVQQFYKEYMPPTLIGPTQGGSFASAPNFVWAEQPGAAYYQLQIDDDPQFASLNIAKFVDTTNYTPVERLSDKEYYWRVRIYDKDKNSGPFEVGRITIDDGTNQVYLPTVMQ